MEMVKDTVTQEKLIKSGHPLTPENLAQYQDELQDKLEKKCLYDPNNIRVPSQQEVASTWDEILAGIRDGVRFVQSQEGLSDTEKNFMIHATLNSPTNFNLSMLDVVCRCFNESKQCVAEMLNPKPGESKVKSAVAELQESLDQAVYLPGNDGVFKRGISDAGDRDAIMAAGIRAAMQSVLSASPPSGLLTPQNITAPESWFRGFKDTVDQAVEPSAVKEAHANNLAIKIVNEAFFVAEELVSNNDSEF